MAFIVSIHAFRGEGDWSERRRFSARTRVSIHAFRGEGDASWVQASCWRLCFNPRLPGGRRPPVTRGIVVYYAFQSTPSGGKATLPDAPHAGS